MPHYSYIYQDFYYYREDMIEIVNLIELQREELRGKRLLCTSFAEDLKNHILGIPRPLKEKRTEPYLIKDTWHNADGSVMIADDVGRV
jgi:hypothetical protein